MSEDPDQHEQSRLFTTDDGEFDESRAKEDTLPVEDGEVINTDELADHQTYIEGRGIYDERNPINDLTGKEWKFATKSVLDKQYPPDFQHELRGQHGGQKPPRLCADIIQRFTQAGDVILDPFAGVGGTLFGASLCEYEGSGFREAIGFEINDEWIEVYEEVLEAENADRAAAGKGKLQSQDIRHGDCEELITELENSSVDFLLTDVPYWSMDKVEQTRNVNKTRESKLGGFNTNSLQTKDEWLDDMQTKFEKFKPVIKEDGYIAVFIGDMYREQSYNFLSADLARSIQEVGLTLKANLIWYDPSKDLHVYGYPFSYIPSMVHQNILIFRKEN
ncbi:DNA methyltransferase [Natribaculum luteum]|uniref:Type II methyltransferase n=1 Tax=Natribaculum luteum TaxID=1586232 RepID=A0ABD5P296_9EURY|nr:DNA methyltransferase [Natribaculum luteum]